MILLADLSHWNDPNLSRLYRSLRDWSDGEEPGLIVKLSDGRTPHNDGIDKANRALDVGFKRLSGYHFFRPEIDPVAQSDIFLVQWSKFSHWTVRHANDLEKTEVYPTSSYQSDVAIWYNLVDAQLSAPGMFYSSLSHITTYFTDPAWAIHPLWLSQPPTNQNYKYLIGSPTIPLPWLHVTIHQESFYNFLGRYFGDPGNNHIDLNKAWTLPAAGAGQPTPPPIPPDPPDPPSGDRKCMTVVNALSIRTGPSSTYERTGYLNKNEVVEVLASLIYPDGTTEWVQHARGWSCHHTAMNTYMQDVK